MDEEYVTAFELITKAGTSKSTSMLALQAARAGELDKARELLEQAGTDLLAAHHVQTDLVQGEAAGRRVPLNIILVHAQDHLTSAILLRDLAEEFIHLYARLADGAADVGEVGPGTAGELGPRAGC